MPEVALLITCEHAGNDVPAAYRPSMRYGEAMLRSHRGYDPGASEVASRLAREFGAPIKLGAITRLLIDLNRPLNDPDLFTSSAASLTAAQQSRLIRRYHQPHWQRVARLVKRAMAKADVVVHIGVHSFTPVRRGAVRQAEIGLLYDPTRAQERDFCAVWMRQLKRARPRWRIRANYPYQGVSPGLTTSLRAMFPARSYLGVELEVSQKLLKTPAGRRRVEVAVCASLAPALHTFSGRVAR